MQKIVLLASIIFASSAGPVLTEAVGQPGHTTEVIPAPKTSGLAERLPIPPPLTLAQAKYFSEHPGEWSAILDRAPKLTTFPFAPQPQTTLSPTRNTWIRVSNPPPTGKLSNPLLLTDGSVIIHVSCSATWHKLTPDAFGSYLNGSWSTLAAMPGGYAPLYFASQVLNNGQVVVNGGEYESHCANVWSNKGAIYTPSSNTWANLAPPSGWTTIGDAQSIILPNGTYMLANCCTTEQALFSQYTSTWIPTGTGKLDVNDEEGWALLHDGTVLTADAYVGTGTCGQETERYDADTGSWSSAGNLTAILADCTESKSPSHEIGPIVVRPDGTAIAFGGTTNGIARTSIYNPRLATWSSGPDVPTIAGRNYNLADAPGVALPNGNVFFAASPGLFGMPVHFFEFTAANSIVQRPDTPNAKNDSAYVVNFLMLPTGQVLQTDFSNDVQIYTPSGTYRAAWRPKIISVPTALTRGKAYRLYGSQLAGITHGVYGDDQQAATNFPLVRLTNIMTHRVYYATTSAFTTRSIQPGLRSAATFRLPAAAGMPAGNYDLEAVANGIPSPAIVVTVD